MFIVILRYNLRLQVEVHFVLQTRGPRSSLSPQRLKTKDARRIFMCVMYAFMCLAPTGLIGKVIKCCSLACARAVWLGMTPPFWHFEPTDLGQAKQDEKDSVCTSIRFLMFWCFIKAQNLTSDTYLLKLGGNCETFSPLCSRAVSLCLWLRMKSDCIYHIRFGVSPPRFCSHDHYGLFLSGSRKNLRSKAHALEGPCSVASNLWSRKLIRKEKANR